MSEGLKDPFRHPILRHFSTPRACTVEVLAMPYNEEIETRVGRIVKKWKGTAAKKCLAASAIF